MSVVKLDGLVALLEGFPALTGVDLDVEAGVIIFVKGPNGAGKQPCSTYVQDSYSQKREMVR